MATTVNNSFLVKIGSNNCIRVRFAQGGVVAWPIDSQQYADTTAASTIASRDITEQLLVRLPESGETSYLVTLNNAPVGSNGWSVHRGPVGEIEEGHVGPQNVNVELIPFDQAGGFTLTSYNGASTVTFKVMPASSSSSSSSSESKLKSAVGSA